MDFRMNFVERKVYNFFDFIRDLGGLISGLHGFFIILVAIFQYQDLHYFMVSNLYRKE